MNGIATLLRVSNVVRFSQTQWPVGSSRGFWLSNTRGTTMGNLQVPFCKSSFGLLLFVGSICATPTELKMALHDWDHFKLKVELIHAVILCKLA